MNAYEIEPKTIWPHTVTLYFRNDYEQGFISSFNCIYARKTSQCQFMNEAFPQGGPLKHFCDITDKGFCK